MPVLSTLGAMAARGFGWLFRGAGGAGLFAWGYNNTGQLGLGDLTNRSSPVQVGALATWAKTGAGYVSSYAIKSDGTLWSWGYNFYGGLGLGDAVTRSSPVQVGALTTWNAVAGMYLSAHAIKTDGTLWAWGANFYGDLGVSNTTNYSSPVQVGALTNWASIGVGSPNTTRRFVTAVKTDGTLWAWGWGTQHNGGTSGNAFDVTVSTPTGGPTAIDRQSPVQIGSATNWARASSGAQHSLAITTTGALYAWGNNIQGECGQGATAYNNPDLYYPTTPDQFCLGPDWQWYSSPYYGGVYGNDPTLTICDPYYVTWNVYSANTQPWGYSLPTQVGALTTWSKVSAGNFCSFAVKTDGTLWSWGSASLGQLGTNNTTSYSSPVQVGALTTWANVSAGQSSFALAVKTDGTLWAWGDNSQGQLGQGNTTSRSSPVQVGTATNWLSTGFSAGGLSSLAIRS